MHKTYKDTCFTFQSHSICSFVAPVLKTCAYFWSIVKSTTDLLNGEADKWDQINSELDVTEDGK